TAFLFESTEGDSRLARYSFVGIDPIKTIAFGGGQATVTEYAEKVGRERKVAVSNPLDFLKDVLAEAHAQGISGCPDLPFSGGLVGYLGYGATRYFENIPQQDTDPFQVPVGYYGLYDSVIVFDHQYRKIKVVSHRGVEHARSLVKRLIAPSVLLPLADQEGSLSDGAAFDDVSGPFTRESFVDLVEKSKHYIREGQVFQIVVSQR